ncbi:phosphoinositide phosphatase SAC4-like [Asparagus officinalis]|uniref:phosphoinositide phosphatase SAC4-like n=1 Tax=Asparagus officinalis TaxID=4686 RepID=UPI00098E78CF|nr:phosphoinositide phosphatase SAC4-like [Asparagus officinalis]
MSFFSIQAKLSISGKDFNLTLIARRSRHYAGTRYLKRGVNEKGSVANDVETEQIIFEDSPGGTPTQISSVVQNRGSIPLFWAQETSRLNLKPDIVLQQKDKNYEATRLHFENLVKRYGNPIIILNLIKTREKKPRESILRAEFANAIDIINKDLPEDNRLRFLHWDLNKHSRSKGTNVLATLGKVAAYALTLTGFFYCQVTPLVSLEGALKYPQILKEDADEFAYNDHHNYSNNRNDGCVNVEIGTQADNAATSDNSASGSENSEIYLVKPPKFQKGVLRTNCIDCLDRTNVAQYAYGLAAIGHQLHALGFISFPKVDIDAPLANDLMGFYETMGDTLALQYGGSAAHNKIFSERRGQWKAATQSQEFFRTLQRYYSNAYMDAEKQAAINLFLGHFQPQQGKPALWELDPDQHYSGERRGNRFAIENGRSFMKRSLSDGNILRENNSTPVTRSNVGHKRLPNSAMSDRKHEVGDAQDLSESTPETLACVCDISYSRCTPMPGRKLFAESMHSYFSEHGFDESTCSNFLDLDCLSSSSNSCEEETSERYHLITSAQI